MPVVCCCSSQNLQATIFTRFILNLDTCCIFNLSVGTFMDILNFDPPFFFGLKYNYFLFWEILNFDPHPRVFLGAGAGRVPVYKKGPPSCPIQGLL